MNNVFKIKVQITKTVCEEKDWGFNRYSPVPSWIFEKRICDKCGWEISGNIGNAMYESSCIVAGDGCTTLVFHERCFFNNMKRETINDH